MSGVDSPEDVPFGHRLKHRPAAPARQHPPGGIRRVEHKARLSFAIRFARASRHRPPGSSGKDLPRPSVPPIAPTRHRPCRGAGKGQDQSIRRSEVGNNGSPPLVSTSILLNGVRWRVSAPTAPSIQPVPTQVRHADMAFHSERGTARARAMTAIGFDQIGNRRSHGAKRTDAAWPLRHS